MNKEVTILMKLTDRASAGFGKISKAFSDSVRNLQTSVAGAKKAISDYVKGMQEGSKKAREFADGLKTIAVASGIVAGAVLLVAKSSLGAAIEMESLKLGLASVAGSAQAAEAQMKELHEIAKLPGLGLQEAIQGSTRLQAVGINAQLANKALMEFGNALARVGKGREELSGVILALTQIVGKGKVTAEEINQIAERVPEVRKVMMEAFGTASTEAIQKMNISAESFIETLVSGFEKLPRVVGGTRNEIENFNDAVFNAKVAVGQALLPVFTQVLGVLTKLVGWFNQLSDTQKAMITWAGAIIGGLAALTAGLAGVVLLIPKVVSGLAALKTAYLFLQSTQTLGLTAALGGATIAAAGLYIGLKKISEWYEKNAIEKGAVRLAEGLKPMTAQEEYEELGKTLDRQRQKLENLRKVQAELARTTPTTTMEALRPAAIEAEMQRIEAGMKQLEARRTKIAPIDKQSLTQFAQEVTKLADDIRKAEAQTAEIRAGLITDEQQRELEMLRVRHEANIKEIDARMIELKGATTEEVQLMQALNDKKLALEQQYHHEQQQVIDEYTKKNNDALEKEADESQKRLNEWVKDRVQAGVLATNAEMKELENRRKAEQAELKKMLIPYLAHEEQITASQERIAKAAMKDIDDEIQAVKELNKIKIGLTETYFKIRMAQIKQEAEASERLRKIESDAYETRWRDFSIFNKKIIEEQDKQVEEFIEGLSEWNTVILDIQDDFGGFVSEVKSGLESLGVEFDAVTEAVFRFFEALISGEPLKIIGSGINFIAKMIDNMTGPGFGGFVIDWENLNQSIEDARTKIKGLTKDLETARGTRGMGAMAVAIEGEIETLEKTIVILEGRLAGIDFAEALRPGLESSWNELWQSLFDPDSVIDPLESFADSVDEMIFNQLVEIFTKTPELMEQARKLGEYIAFALNNGIISQTEKYEIDRYRALLVKEYETNTKKLMVAVDALDLQIRGVQKDATEDAAKSITQSAEKIVSAGEEFSKTLQSSLGSSWTNLWKSMFGPDAVIKPLEDFANTLDEMIFQQLVAVFTKSPEIIQLAKDLGEYIAAAFQDGIVSELEKQRIDEYRKQLVQVYGENTEKLMTAVDMLDLQVRQSRTAQQDAIDWMEFTKVGLLGTQALDDITMRDILMKPQQEYFDQLGAGYPKTTTTATPDAESLMLSGKPPQVSDVVETRPGVTFIQNNQFSGLVNFDNPEAMRELARKLQPYTEELQERWVSG